MYRVHTTVHRWTHDAMLLLSVTDHTTKQTSQPDLIAESLAQHGGEIVGLHDQSDLPPGYTPTHDHFVLYIHKNDGQDRLLIVTVEATRLD